jgi:outer membrane autotransporter protein
LPLLVNLSLATAPAMAQSVTVTDDVYPGGAMSPVWDVGGDLVVGDSATGTLTIVDGGRVSSTFGYIGFGLVSEGTVTVTGAASTWTNSGHLYVGTYGTGELRIADGGAVSNAYGYIGRIGGSTGTVIVSGTDANGSASSWINSGWLEVGTYGTGMLTIEGGGAVSNTDGYIGRFSGSTGTVIVSGTDENRKASSWDNSFDLRVGSQGTGTLRIADGGTVSNTVGYIGRNGGSTGTVIVSGTDGNGNASSWINDSWLDVGTFGTGTLRIADGGAVSNTVGYIGRYSGSTGTAIVSGTDGNGKASSWDNSFDLIVGSQGAGTLRIADGGAVSNTVGYIGRYNGSTGTVTVSGTDGNGNASTWTNFSSLYVGYAGAGALMIEGGGTVRTGHGWISPTDLASGAVSVTGSGSLLEMTGDLQIANHGAGAVGVVTLAEHGTADISGVIGMGYQNPGGTARLVVGADSPNPADALVPGTVNATRIHLWNDSASVAFNHTATHYIFDIPLHSMAAGVGIIDHHAGTTVLAADSSGFTGATNISGGVLTVANALGGTARVSGGELIVDGSFGGDVEAQSSGRVSGSGTITGNADFTGGGVLSGTQGRTLRIDGNVDMDAGSVLSVTLGGAPSAALFDVGGNLTLDGTLNVADQGGFGMGVYRLFDYAGTLTDNGLAIGAMPAGAIGDNFTIQTSVASQVNLISTAGATLGFWDGGDASLHDNGVIDGGSGTWRADGRNWTGADGALNGPFQPNPTFAIFQGQSGTVSVDASAGGIGVTGMQFATDGYRIDGDTIALEGAGGESIIRVGDGTAAGTAMTATIASALTGNSMLVKSDHGTLILSGNNSYEGGTRIDAGVLSIAADDSLGHADGALIFNGGTLATTASFDSGRQIMLTGNGRFDVGDATVLGLDGDISGSGNLVMAGEGTLVLTGSNAYGGTRVEAGTLVGNAGSISGNVANAGTVVFDQTGDAGFAGDIAGLNGTNGDMILRGGATLTLGGSSALDWTIEDGTLETAAARFAGDVLLDGAGTSLVFTDTADARYAGVLSGNGTFTLDGGGSVLLTGDSSGFTGTTTVSGGRLVVGDGNGNGALGGNLAIADGGMLGGAGTIGSGAGSTVTLGTGGTLSPGNSIGTLTVDGDLVFSSGSRFEVEVNPQGTDSDLVRVTGTATLNGGTVAHIGATGTYDLRSTYTILSAGTLAGAFDEVTSAFAFLTPDLVYDYGAGTVDLSLVRNDREFASIALTSNQIATAGGIESIGIDAGHAVYDAIAQLADDDDLIRGSFDALSGEIHASARTALTEDSRFVRNAANDRIRAAFGDAGAALTSVLAYGPDKAPILVSADHAGPVFWSSGFGSWGSTDSDGNAASLDRSIGGLLIGADTMAGDWRVGVLAGYSHSRIRLDERASSASSDNYHLGLYGGTQWGDIALRTGAAYSWHEIDTSRAVSIPGLTESLSAGYTAGTFQAFGELGYGIDLGDTRLEPFVNLAHVHLHGGGFSETGGAAALSGRSGSTDVTFTTLGLRGEQAMALGTIEARLNGMIGWRYAFGDTMPASTHAFSASGPFTIAGAPIARNSAVIEAGLDLDLSPSATFGLSYTGQLSSHTQDHGVRANLSVRF